MKDILIELLLILFFGYLICISGICLIGTIRNICVSKVQLMVILIGMMISYSFLSFFIIGKDGWDLNVYYSVIDRMRAYGFDAINSNGGMEFFDLPGTKGIFFLVSKLEYNNYLQAFVVLIDYFILLYGLWMVVKKDKIQFRAISIFLIVHFAMSSIAYAISGIRNTLAFAIVSLAIIRDISCNKRNVITLVLYLLPITIHPAVLIVLLLRALFFMLPNKKILCAGLFFWTFFMKGVIKLSTPLSIIPFFEMVITKANSYMHLGIKNLFENFKYELFRIIVVVILLTITTKVLKYSKITYTQRKTLEFIKCVYCLTLGCIPVFILFDRLCIFVAWISFLPINIYLQSNDICKTDWSLSKKVLIMLIVSILLALMNVHHLLIFAQFNIPWR